MIRKCILALFICAAVQVAVSAQNTHTVTLSRDQLGAPKTRTFTPEQMKQILERDRARVEYINSRINGAKEQLQVGPGLELVPKTLSREKFDEFKQSLGHKSLTLDEINRKVGLPETHFPF